MPRPARYVRAGRVIPSRSADPIGTRTKQCRVPSYRLNSELMCCLSEFLEVEVPANAWSTIVRPWVTSETEYGRRPPREDREFRSFAATVPPRIASTTFSYDSRVERVLVDATLEIAALEAS